MPKEMRTEMKESSELKSKPEARTLTVLGSPARRLVLRGPVVRSPVRPWTKVTRPELRGGYGNGDTLQEHEMWLANESPSDLILISLSSLSRSLI